MALKGAEDGAEAQDLDLLPPRHEKSLSLDFRFDWRVCEGEGGNNEVWGVSVGLKFEVLRISRNFLVV